MDLQNKIYDPCYAIAHPDEHDAIGFGSSIARAWVYASETLGVPIPMLQDMGYIVKSGYWTGHETL